MAGAQSLYQKDRNAILTYLQKHEGARARDVSRGLNMHSSQRASKMLIRMTAEREIYQVKVNGGYTYYTSQSAHTDIPSHEEEILLIAQKICKTTGYVRSHDIHHEMPNKCALSTKKIASVLRYSDAYEVDHKHTSTSHVAYKLVEVDANE